MIVDPPAETLVIPVPPTRTGFKGWLTRTVFLGQEPTPELLAILLVYFVQGILGLARLAVSFFFKDELGLTPAEVAALMGVVALPWVLKPLFGLLSDSLPLFGYRRRSYLILSGFLGCGAWVYLALGVTAPWQATLAIALSSLAIAVSDVIVDSLVVERARGESVGTAGTLQSLCWGATAVGGIITAYLSGQLLAHFSTDTIFLITATFPLLVSGVAGFIHETPLTERPKFSATWTHILNVAQALKQKQIWLPVAFLFLWQATPSSDSAFFFFTTNELGFDPEFLGRVRLVTSLAALLGVWIFQRFLRGLPVRTIFLWSTILSAALGMTTLLLVTHVNRGLGIDDHWFSLGDSLILTVMGQIAFMPVLVLAARLCPPGIEATLFALLMAISNLANLVSHETGALLTHWLGISDQEFGQLWILVVVANLSTLLPLPLLNWLPDQAPTFPTLVSAAVAEGSELESITSG
ncbi:folate/biopterin family MFS transporter [Thermosynechococcaceae cyanobacterium BACA0444]|uniref:Folate/biopterin family MFS transporter n=1 Tax=Pseudocalidococcus azoricus BACA0444 TaxID=2918990 RepID=A0AAE4FV93_9CYAN|nr:folate/biopterin family MFS transporter [Pseudocalidococcus azoricus]MDS3861681.1 folate/biopterin family MFS transporter [Pseudocalidococcus azoricus BACA0444]